jgi:pyruvate dehydrogenase E1 component alpha subunit
MVQERTLPVFQPKANEISKKDGLTYYEDMVLGRFFEDKCAEMYYRGKMFGFVHLYNGQEAVSSGVIKSLRSDDYVCSTYRDHVHALSAGVPANNVMAELFGKETGLQQEDGGGPCTCFLKSIIC